MACCKLYNNDCKGCVHWRSLSGYHSSDIGCNYFFDTGKLRGCPAGKDCTKYCNDPAVKRRLSKKSKIKEDEVFEDADYYNYG